MTKLREIRRGSHKLYKGKYFIVFYDKTDTEIKYMFDNVREILKFQNKEVTRQNINLVNVELCRALRTETRFTRFLTGEVLKVFIIEDDEIN